MYICESCSRRRRQDIADNTLVDGRMALIRITWVCLDNMPRQGLHASTMITNWILTIPFYSDWNTYVTWNTYLRRIPMWQKGLSGCHDTVEAADMAGVTVLVVLTFNFTSCWFSCLFTCFFAAFYLFFDFTAKSVAVMCSDSPASNLCNQKIHWSSYWSKTLLKWLNILTDYYFAIQRGCSIKRFG